MLWIILYEARGLGTTLYLVAEPTLKVKVFIKGSIEKVLKNTFK